MPSRSQPAGRTGGLPQDSTGERTRATLLGRQGRPQGGRHRPGLPRDCGGTPREQVARAQETALHHKQRRQSHGRQGWRGSQRPVLQTTEMQQAAVTLRQERWAPDKSKTWAAPVSQRRHGPRKPEAAQRGGGGPRGAPGHTQGPRGQLPGGAFRRIARRGAWSPGRRPERPASASRVPGCWGSGEAQAPGGSWGDNFAERWGPRVSAVPAEVENARLVEGRGSRVSPQALAEPEVRIGCQVITEPECLSRRWDLLARHQAGQWVPFETVSKSEKTGHKHTDPPMPH